MKAKLFVYFLFCFLMGAAVAPYIEICTGNFFLLAMVIFCSSFVVFRKRIFWTILVGISLILFSISNFQNQTVKYQNLNIQYQDNTSFVGYVDSLETVSGFGSKVKVKITSANNEKENFLVNLYKEKYPSLKYGDVIKFEGKLKPYEDFAGYLIKERVAGEINVKEFHIIGKERLITKPLFDLRSKMNLVLKKSLPGAEANLASGLILGEKSLQTASFTRELQASGTSHIIALSGYNITILISVFALLNKKFSRYLNLLLPALLITAFVLMTGGSASVVRAGIMGFMPIIARFIGRPANTFIAIFFSAAIMVLFNPYILIYDVGFQLSFAAMFGISYVSPIFERLFESESIFIKILAETVGAQLAVLPLLIWYFGQVSIIAPISNLVILSLVPIGMLVSFLTAFLGLIHEVLGSLFGLISFPVLNLINKLITYFGRLPISLIQFKVENPVWIAIFYLALGYVFFFVKKKDLPQP